jgi:hypothetical protein
MRLDPGDACSCLPSEEVSYVTSLTDSHLDFAVWRWRRLLRLRPIWRNRDRGNRPYHSSRVGAHGAFVSRSRRLGRNRPCLRRPPFPDRRATTRTAPSTLGPRFKVPPAHHGRERQAALIRTDRSRLRPARWLRFTSPPDFWSKKISENRLSLPSVINPDRLGCPLGPRIMKAKGVGLGA